MGLLAKAASTVSEGLGRDSRLIVAMRPVYEWFLDVSSGLRGTEWSVNGEPLRVDPRFRRFLAPRVEPELFAFLRAAVRPGEVILDVGSFLGVYAILLARWAGPTGRVLAFEPTPSVASVLRRHLALNGVSDRVLLLQEAAGSQPGQVELREHSEPYRNAIGATDPMGRATGKLLVPMTTLDIACRETALSPTLIRMDVQGFEYEVLRGAREIIQAGRGRLRIVLEAHPQLWPLHELDGEKFNALLRDLGLRARPLIEGQPLYSPDAHVILDYA